MKKLIAIVLCIVSLFAFASCGKFECGMCGDEASGRKYKHTILGEEVVVCEDCHKDIEALGELFN